MFNKSFLKYSASAAILCLAALPVASHAQPVTGPYVGVGAGTSLGMSMKAKGDNYAGHVFTNPAFAGDGAIGYGFGNGFRVQVDGDYIHNTLHKVDTGDTQSRINGHSNTSGAMVDALYDFNVGLPVYPYAGAGVGYQWQTLKETDKYTKTDGSFAYNVIAGVAYPINMVPGLSATAQYTFMQMPEKRQFNGLKYGALNNNIFELGLRYQLFQPEVTPTVYNTGAFQPVAPTAAPAPVSARTFLVFFDWNKANLTPRGNEIVASAAKYSETSKLTTLNVNGYTDTSGTAAYNTKLSLERAHNVASQLVADGVPAEDIAIKGYGETHLLVPTGPNVREPQNRRVEIIIK